MTNRPKLKTQTLDMATSESESWLVKLKVWVVLFPPVPPDPSSDGASSDGLQVVSSWVILLSELMS